MKYSTLFLGIMFCVLCCRELAFCADSNPKPNAGGGVVKVEENKIPAFILDAYVKLDKDMETAIELAQKELARRQRADGSWNNGSYGGNNAGEVAFAMLALMINGTVPGEGRYSRNVALATQYLLNLQRANGLIATHGGGGSMYQHAMATLALSEVYGMSANPRIRSALIRAVNLIVNSQHIRGGWRYEPRPSEGDISVTVMQVMALRSAADAGIYVPEKTFQLALAFIDSCYNKKDKGFTYMANGGAIGFARTAAGVVSLQSLGLTETETVKNSVSTIMKTAFKGNDGYYWYGHYYSSVALYHFGGQEWQDYYPKIKQKIMTDWRMLQNGKFRADGKGMYPNTLELAWQIMVLGVPYRYLPIYQR